MRAADFSLADLENAVVAKLRDIYELEVVIADHSPVDSQKIVVEALSADLVYPDNVSDNPAVQPRWPSSIEAPIRVTAIRSGVSLINWQSFVGHLLKIAADLTRAGETQWQLDGVEVDEYSGTNERPTRSLSATLRTRTRIDRDE